MLLIQLLFSMIALFVQTELLRSSTRRLPPNRANGVVYSKVAQFGTTPLSSPLLTSIKKYGYDKGVHQFHL